MTTFIHIGLHKSASSYIQSLFANNANLLKRNGIKYPTSGDFEDQRFNDYTIRYDIGLKAGNHSLPLYAAYSKHYDNYYGLQVNSLDPNIYREHAKNCIAKLLQMSHEENTDLILSGEELSNNKFGDTNSALSLIKDAQSINNVELVAIVREPISFSSSLAQQYIKGGQKIEQIRRNFIPLYQQRLECWTNAAKRANIPLHFINLSNKKIDNSISNSCSIEERVLKIVNPESTSLANQMDHSKIAHNPSLSSSQASILSSFNRILSHSDLENPEKFKARNLLLRCLKNTFESEKFQLEAEYFSLNNTEIKKDVEWLNSITKEFQGESISYNHTLNSKPTPMKDEHTPTTIQSKEIARLFYFGLTKSEALKKNLVTKS